MPKYLACRVINGNDELMRKTSGEVCYYSSGHFKLMWYNSKARISVKSGMLAQDRAYALVDKLKIKEKFVIIFYKGNPTSTFLASYYYPKKDCCISTVPVPGSTAANIAYEISHQLTMYYNEHRGRKPRIEDTDSNYSSTSAIMLKFSLLLPFADLFIKK